MRKIFTGLHSLFMLSFCLLLFLEIKSQTEIWAGDIDDFDNESLPLLNINNGNTNEILVLNGATLIDGNGGPPISDSILVIGDNKEIVAVTNQTNFSDNPLLKALDHKLPKGFLTYLENISCPVYSICMLMSRE